LRRAKAGGHAKRGLGATLLASVAVASLAISIGGCTELRTPAPGQGMQVVLSPDPGDPLRGTVRAAAADFADSGRALTGRPREAALAAARLEYLAAAVPADRRFAPMSASVRFALANARTELRNALGTRADAAPQAVIAALAGAARALGTGDTAAAERALSPALFDPGGAETLRRLGELGPLPSAMLASQQTAHEMARLDADQRWFGTIATEPDVSAGQTTVGLGGDSGY